MILVFPHSEMVTLIQTNCHHFSVFEKGESKEILISGRKTLELEKQSV